MTRGDLSEPSAAPAGFSEHGIQKLESGATHPYRDTAERLIRALELGDQDQARFKTAARPTPRRRQPHSPTAGTEGVTTRTNLPNSVTSFVARAGEIQRVEERLRESRM